MIPPGNADLCSDPYILRRPTMDRRCSVLFSIYCETSLDSLYNTQGSGEVWQDVALKGNHRARALVQRLCDRRIIRRWASSWIAPDLVNISSRNSDVSVLQCLMTVFVERLEKLDLGGDQVDEYDEEFRRSEKV